METPKNYIKKQYYLIFLVHGNNGDSKDMFPFKRAISKKFNVNNPKLLKIICSSCNEKNTHVGVKIGGLNLAREIINSVMKLMPQNDDEIFFSIIAHSLGGLFSRSCLSTVFENPICKKHLIPKSFISLNCPHLGVRRTFNSWNPAKIIYNSVVHGVCNYLYNKTGSDLLLNNDVLLNLSKDENLCKFENVTLVGLNNDIIVPFTTSLISLNVPENKVSLIDGLNLVRSTGFNEEYIHLKLGDKFLSNNCECVSNITPKKINNKVPEIVSDNLNQIEFSYEMFNNLQNQKINWRRIYLACGINYSPVAHDMTIKKGDKLFGIVFDIDGCNQFINLITEILMIDNKN